MRDQVHAPSPADHQPGSESIEWVDAANRYPRLLSYNGLKTLGRNFSRCPGGRPLGNQGQATGARDAAPISATEDMDCGIRSHTGTSKPAACLPGQPTLSRMEANDGEPYHQPESLCSAYLVLRLTICNRK